MADEKNIKPTESKPLVKPSGDSPKSFPYSDDDKARLSNYGYFEQLFLGNHYDAFKMRISSEEYNKAYSQLRYVMINFAGMISKIVADMLFGEKVSISMDDPDQQSWVEDFWKENNLDLTFYESALTNSYAGDGVFKLRIGQRHKNGDPTVILDTPSPSLYFPHYDIFNVSGEPPKKELAWVFEYNSNKYLRREIHEIGKITNEVWLLKGDKLERQVPFSEVGLDNLTNQQATGIDRHMIVHVPNWKAGARWAGISDYHDLDSLFFAINNRMTKIDNVLDKHTDPILMVPPGVIGEDGKVKKDNRVIEMGEGEDGKPEYIVWDASLENAFKEIEKLVEFIYMVGEVSPDVLGLGKGQSDSGRALKFKLMRTIAKVNRKKRYYDRAIKEAIYVAQLLSQKWNGKVNGQVFPGKPTMPDLIWQDGLPVDEIEQMDLETKAVDADLSSIKDAMMRIYGYDEETAEKKLKEIREEGKANLPEMGLGKTNPFAKPTGDEPPAEEK